MNDHTRIAGAPISWGVCEVPGWGYQLPAEQVLTQMSEVGLAATELGPDGFLPAYPATLAGTLAAHHLTAVGGFTPFVLHRTEVDPMVELDRLLPGFVAAAADVMVLSADTGLAGYDSRPELDREGWQRLLQNLLLSGRRRLSGHRYSTASLRRALWHWMFTATGRAVMCVG